MAQQSVAQYLHGIRQNLFMDPGRERLRLFGIDMNHLFPILDIDFQIIQG